MDHGGSDLDDLQRRLVAEHRRAWVQAVVGPRVGQAAPLLYALVGVGPRPTAWAERSWAYETCTFISAGLPVRQIASLFVAGHHEVTIGPERATLELQATNVAWLRQPSLASYKRLSLPYPATVFTANMANRTEIYPPDHYLVGAGPAPSFPTFGSAFNAFFFDDFAVTGSGNPQLGELAVCFLETEARIRRVRVRPTSLDVWVDGRSLAGTYLELGGAEYRATAELDKPGRVSLPLPSGLPSDAWLWLKAGAQWLDLRPLGPWGGRLGPGIEFELPRDPAAEVSRLIAQGEGQHLEYKSKLPETADEKRNVFKTVAAFASGDGGTVLFGVDDDGVVSGVSGGPAVARDRLTDLLRDLVRPSPQVDIRTQRLGRRTVLVLEVAPGNGTLYALTLDQNKPLYFARRDATTYYAHPEELEAAVRRGGS